MKKWILCVASLLLVLSLCACTKTSQKVEETPSSEETGKGTPGKCQNTDPPGAAADL